MRIPSEIRRLREELRHLRSGPMRGEKPQGIGIDRFVAHCPGNADSVLHKAREVLELVLERGGETWPSDEEWYSLLPEWFVAECAPETSQEEDEQWLQWWKQLPPDEQARVEKEKKWSLGNWIYWFQPGERQWFWWDATVEDASTLWVAVEVEGWPFPWGDLEWLLRAAGADTVEPER